MVDVNCAILLPTLANCSFGSTSSQSSGKRGGKLPRLRASSFSLSSPGWLLLPSGCTSLPCCPSSSGSSSSVLSPSKRAILARPRMKNVQSFLISAVQKLWNVLCYTLKGGDPIKLSVFLGRGSDFTSGWKKCLLCRQCSILSPAPKLFTFEHPPLTFLKI